MQQQGMQQQGMQQQGMQQQGMQQQGMQQQGMQQQSGPFEALNNLDIQKRQQVENSILGFLQ